MKCDKCGSFNVVAKVVIQGEKNAEELNLCPLCFQKFVKEHPEIQNGNGAKSLNNFLLGTLNLLNSNLSSKVSKNDNKKINIRQCPGCGNSSHNIIKNHITGCSQCYREFSGEIDSVLMEAIGTNTALYEKPPVTKKEKINDIQIKLDKALQTENYEKAALLRDELKIITNSR